MNNIYDKLTSNDEHTLRCDFVANGGFPLLRTVYYVNRDTDKDAPLFARKTIGFANGGWGDCLVEDPCTSGWSCLTYNSDRDSSWMTIFRGTHWEYYRMITLHKGEPIIVVFPDRKEAYRGTFEEHAMRYGYGHYVDVSLEDGRNLELHCGDYEKTWLLFPAE